jgi:hypothetical protein
MEKMIAGHFPKKTLFFLSLFFLIFPKIVFALDISVLEKKDVVILFEDPLGSAAEKAAAIYPALRNGLEKALGWKVNFRPRVLLVKDNSAFQSMTGSRLIVAFALPERDLMVIDYSRMNMDPFTLESTMKHELCHLLLHSYIKRENLPRWLDEGIAQWVSDGLSDIVMSRDSVLDEAILSGRYMRISDLAGAFPGDGRAMTLAYEESRSFIDYIVGEYGPEGILKVLDSLRQGEPVDSAFLKSFSVPFDEVERGWNKRIKKRITWVTLLINNLYQILFFLAALALIYGFIRRLIKRRSYKDYDEEDFG